MMHWLTRACLVTWSVITSIDWSKILGGQQKYWGQKVTITDETIDVSQLLGARARAAPPKVYAYECNSNNYYYIHLSIQADKLR